ncbi:hypothetical protein COOONC_28682 [Cooperia oncophora]
MTAEGGVWNHIIEKILSAENPAQKQTADDLALSEESSEMCAMSRIGGYVEKSHSSVVTLRICTAYGMEITLKDHLKPIITMEDKHYLQLNELCICNPRVHGEHQTPHTLVGLDHCSSLQIARL